jgi:hypothetical protein
MDKEIDFEFFTNIGTGKCNEKISVHQWNSTLRGQDSP